MAPLARYALDLLSLTSTVDVASRIQGVQTKYGNLATLAQTNALSSGHREVWSDLTAAIDLIHPNEYKRTLTSLATEITEFASSSSSSSSSGGDFVIYDFYMLPQDVAYSAVICMGTPVQCFLFQMDTGSSDLWVAAAQVAPQGAEGFDYTKSSTFQDTGASTSIQYVKGAENLEAVVDTVQIGGLYQLKQKTFGLGTDTPASIPQGSSGIVGIGPSTTAVLAVPTIVENLIIDGLVTETYVTIYMARAIDNQTLAQSDQSGLVPNGQMCIGCTVTLPSTVQTVGDVVAVPVLTDDTGAFYSWEGEADGFVVSGQLVQGTQVTTIFDTGTTDIYLPTAIAPIFAEAMGATILSDSSFALPVSAVTDDFAIGLAFSGQPFYIDLEDVVLGYTDSSQQYYALSIYAADIPDSFGNNIVLAGDAFLKNVILGIDYDYQGAPAVLLQQIVSSSETSSGSSGTQPKVSAPAQQAPSSAPPAPIIQTTTTNSNAPLITSKPAGGQASANPLQGSAAASSNPLGPSVAGASGGSLPSANVVSAAGGGASSKGSSSAGPTSKASSLSPSGGSLGGGSKSGGSGRASMANATFSTLITLIGVAIGARYRLAF